MKLTKRKGFNFFRSYYDVYNMLPPEEKIAFIDALLDRQFLGVKPTELKGMAKFAYVSQTNSIDSQVKGYNDKMTKLGNPLIGNSFTPTDGGQLTPTVQVEEKEKVKEQEKEKVKEEEKEKKETLPKKTEKLFSDDVLNCFNNCLKIFPEHLHPKKESEIQSWKLTLDKLNRIEKIPFDTIIEIVKKTRENDFWSKNFLTLNKLRKKNKDGILYVVVFNEQIKANSSKTDKQIYEEAINSKAARDFKFV
jgi:hypothetical protein